MQISDLEDTLKEKNNKLTEIREKVVELLELIDDDYSDMPPLVEQ
jgi:Fe2+ or Zn2+ uptake regulation protein